MRFVMFMSPIHLTFVLKKFSNENGNVWHISLIINSMVSITYRTRTMIYLPKYTYDESVFQMLNNRGWAVCFEVVDLATLIIDG